MTRFNVCVFLQGERNNENNSFGYLLEQSIWAAQLQTRTILYQHALSNKIKNVDSLLQGSDIVFSVCAS